MPAPGPMLQAELDQCLVYQRHTLKQPSQDAGGTSLSHLIGNSHLYYSEVLYYGDPLQGLESRRQPEEHGLCTEPNPSSY